MLNNANIEDNWDDVGLLLPFDVNFIDVKHSHNIAEMVGNPIITKSTTQIRFGSGAISFNGINDRLRYMQDDDTKLGSGDFTVEFWCYPKNMGSAGGGAVGNIRGLFANNTVYSTTPSSRTLLVKIDASAIYLEVAGIPVGASKEIGTYQWYHVAVSRIGTDLRFFVNGELIHTYTSANYDFPTTNMIIGAANVGSWAHFSGNIDDFRFTKNVGRYSDNFVPPTDPYPVGFTTREAVNYFPMARFLARNGNTDSSYNNHRINYNRPPDVSAEKLFIDGTNSYFFLNTFFATVPDNDFRLGNNNFTIECWVNASTTSNYQTICSSYGFPTWGNFWMGLTGNVLEIRYGAGGSDSRYLRHYGFVSNLNTYTHRIPANKWCHVAWTREYNVNRIFIGGKLAVTFYDYSYWGSNVLTFGASAFQMAVFRQANLSSWWEQYYNENSYYTGFINDIRVSNLVCKYKSDFDPYAEYPLKRDRDTSLFDPDNMSIDYFEPVIMSKVEVENNNNIFWFNDNSGFVLQKPASNTPGVWITAAARNTSTNEISITTSDGVTRNLGTIFNTTPVPTSTAVGSGNLSSISGTELTFTEFTVSGDVVKNDISTRQTLTSNKVYDKGVSTLGCIRLSVCTEPGVLYNSGPTANAWNTQVLNTIASSVDGVILNTNGSFELPAGRYLVVGIAGSYTGSYSAWRLYNNTTSQELLKTNSEFFGGNTSTCVAFEGSFSLLNTSTLVFQQFPLTTATTSLGMPAAFGHSMQQNLTIFKVD